MNYNIHPIFVHFPIAFLFIYSLIKLFPFNKWFPKVAWKQIEIILLVVGVLGAFVADSTGEVAKHLSLASRQIIRVHATFAQISTFLYSLLMLGEILFFVTPVIIPKLKAPQLTTILVYIQNIILDPIFTKIIIILGFMAITMTGLLGGALVYGTTADPFTAIILKLFGLSA